jgi:hypothetical protein
MEDVSKFFLFLVLAIAVLVLVSDKRRPLATAPLDGSTDDASQTASDASMISRGPGFANVASNMTTPPLSLMMPAQGLQPISGCDDGGVL